MKILITGASNYIVIDLINFFLRSKKDIYIFATYKEKKPKIKNIRLKFLKINLKKKIKKIKNINLFIHCAAATPLRNYSNLDYYKINVLGFKKILEAIYNKNLTHIVLFSTMSVYGQIRSKVVKETHPLNGKTAYALSKIKMEKFLTNFSKKNNVNGLTLRLPGVIGVKKNNNNFLSNVIKCVKEEKTFKIFGPYNKFNNLIGSYDIYKIILRFLKNNENKNDIFNCSVSKSHTLIKVLRLIEKLTKKKSLVNIIKKKKSSFLIDNSSLLKNGYKVSSMAKTLKQII